MEKELSQQTLKKNAREFQIYTLIENSYWGMTKIELRHEIGCDYRTITTYVTRLLKLGKIKIIKEKRKNSLVYIKA